MSGTCPVCRDITCKYPDLTRDEELVDMFKEILARRDALDEGGAVVAGDATDVRQSEDSMLGQASLDTLFV